MLTFLSQPIQISKFIVFRRNPSLKAELERVININSTINSKYLKLKSQNLILSNKIIQLQQHLSDNLKLNSDYSNEISILQQKLSQKTCNNSEFFSQLYKNKMS
jgi:hypothetical protein